jgi:hypothetical protein
MRLRRLRGNGWAARLALLALALNSLVPVHLAFDLAEALAPSAHHAAGGHGLEWRLLARLSGHLRPAGDHGKHHSSDCPVCNALASLGSAPPAAAPTVPLPAAVAVVVAVLPIPAVRAGAPAAAYRSRAPPAA